MEICLRLGEQIPVLVGNPQALGGTEAESVGPVGFDPEQLPFPLPLEAIGIPGKRTTLFGLRHDRPSVPGRVAR